MIKMLHTLALALVLFAAPAHAQQAGVSGWWHARVENGGDSADLYIGFVTENGQPATRMSMPAARLHGVGFGPYEVADGVARIPGTNWTFNIDDSGNALDAQLPELAPGKILRARFTRSEAPPALAQVTASEQAPSPVWTANVGAEVWAGLVHNRQRNLLYVVAANGEVSAFNARTGARVWMRGLGVGAHATPTLHRGRLYVPTDDALVALNAANGAELWRAPFGPQRSERLPINDPNSQWDHYSASAAIDGDLIVVGARDGCMHALALRTGASRWRTCIDALITSTPAIRGDRVYFGGFDGAAYAVSRADGRQVWKRETGQAIPRDAVIAGDAILFGGRNFDLMALDLATGEPRWQHHFWFSWVDAPQTVRDGVIYSGASDGMHVQAFDLNGARLWASPSPGWTWGGVAVGDASLYVGAAGAERYFAPRAGGLMAMDRQSGALRWLMPVTQPEGAFVYGFAAQPAIAGRRVFAADLTGAIYAFDDN
jgi:outer membrane protein assembly factor BamB